MEFAAEPWQGNSNTVGISTVVSVLLDFWSA